MLRALFLLIALLVTLSIRLANPALDESQLMIGFWPLWAGLVVGLVVVVFREG